MVPQPELQVLVDLSLGVLGYSGIPQETRLLFKSLSEAAGVSTTGLLFSVAGTPLPPRPALSATKGQQCEYQARVLHTLVHGTAAPRANWWNRLTDSWDLCRDTCRAVLARPESLEELDVETFWDVLWRRWLSYSLADNDRALAHRPVCFTSVNRAMLNRGAQLGLPGPRLDTAAFDFALFHEARPVRVSRTTCKLVRHYDLIPVVRPDLVSSRKQIEAQARGVQTCLRDSIFTCISEAVREDLIRLYPEVAERTVTIPCTLPDGYYPDPRPKALSAIVANHGRSTPKQPLADVPPFLLIVSAIEPRKNHVALARAFEQVLASRDTDLCLMVVGAPGWNCEEILQRLGMLEQRGRLFHLDRVPLNELRVLYSEARAVIFPSLYEGFGYSPLEAMCCGTPVIASDIAAHRHVYGDAVRYCDPYSVDSISAAIEAVCLDADSASHTAMTARGFRRVQRYRTPAVSAQWRALLTELRRQGITHNVADARLARFNDELRAIGEAHVPISEGEVSHAA